MMVAAAAASFLATRVVLALLRRRNVLDHPNERSSHQQPTPRGGGIAVVAVIAVAWLVISLQPDIVARSSAELTSLQVILAVAIGLASLSFLDDLRGLPILRRFGGQIVAVAVGVLMLPEQAMLFQDLLPYGADRILAAFVWLWFINLYNFMDGIDGITTIESVSITVGILLLGTFGFVSWHFAAFSTVIAGALIGFGFWNWHPAKIFLGDVGSVPLGYVLGFLLISLAAQGQWAVALLLPLYYLADATLTLLRRLARGEKVWRAHRSHFYQHAARAWGNHARVSLVILGLNLLLIALAVCAAIGALADWTAVVIGGGASGFLLWYFHCLPERPVDEA